MTKTERIVIENQTIIVWKNTGKVFATVKANGEINRDPLAVRSAQIKVNQYSRVC